MAKQRHTPEPTSSKAPLAMMAVGALLVAGLVVWALTRTVDTTTPAGDTSYTAVPTATGPANTPAVDTGSTAPPAASATAPFTAAPITATSQAPPPVQGERGSVARISVEDLREKIKGGNVTIIDVRDSSAYQSGHIPGSLNIPFASMQGQLDLIPKGKEIVTYCT